MGSAQSTTRVPQKHIWIALIAPPLLLGGLIGGYAVLSGATGAEGGELERAIRTALPYIIAVNHTLVLGLLLYLLRKSNYRFIDIGWRTDEATSIIREIAMGLLVGVGIYLFKELAIDSIRALAAGQAPTFYSLFDFRLDMGDVPMIVVATSFVFVEESVYRGYAIPPLRARYGIVGALFFSSVLFGLLHWGNGLFAIGATGTIGLILALVFVWRRNLIAGTAAHAFYNLLVLLT